MADLKIGDRVRVIRAGFGASACNGYTGVISESVEDHVINGFGRYANIIVRLDKSVYPNGDGIYWGLGGDCELELISSAQNTMADLNTLTKEQKSALKPEDQALIELGVIGNDLTLQDKQYVIDFLFQQNRDAIAAQAVKDVAEIKAAKQPVATSQE